jgi:hypothetical protein
MVGRWAGAGYEEAPRRAAWEKERFEIAFQFSDSVLDSNLF